jgi:hypothetical protein
MSWHEKPVRLAGAVLTAAVDQDWGKARRALDRLNTECASDGLGVALVAWCDALAEHANDGMPEFGKVRVLDLAQETGARLTETTPQQRWANRLIAARAAGDLPAFQALLDELNAIGDGMERGLYASVLIGGVAGTIRIFPRGYARMGRP